ncbi:siderophore-interacting protein [Arthrobacter woluwensis]|uniref:NADPH-dependent ferric siderophore reductase, contains FAD-binding and SIP domains n=1 Tax=Arthrobacter woluwensis TaxID=156980 RepID=A0A1H4P9N7_9MICC|nr:siderophore-interacting protein [Arthrobacter woluwensis]SEC03944.1 NADPH-dependent ferric siderophore reductase, contains FAD-binding and SIP domains [Arthrobacter woluwensis]
MSPSRITVHPLVLRRVEVLRVLDVTPRMRRITLGGEELGAFSRDGLSFPGFASPGFDDHVKILLASEGSVEDILPRQLEHGIEWGAAPHRQARDYTPRRVGHHDLDLDFVLHSAGPADGPAEAWARAAKPGDPLWFVGPKSSTRVPEDADRALLIADETGLPAISRFLEERPLTVPVRALITIGHDSARQELATRPGDRIDWIVAEPGDPAALEEAVAALEPEVWEGTPYVWAAAEARSLLPVRKLTLRRHGVPRSRTDITGYWHVRREEPAAATGTEQRGPAAAPSGAEPIPSPLAWLAVRAALEAGILDAVDDGAHTAGELEARLGLASGSTSALLSFLTFRGVLATGPQGLTLGPLGTEVLGDEHAREEFQGSEADAVLALTALPGALRTGRSAWQVMNGVTLAESVAGDPELAEELAEEAGGLAYLMPGLVALPLWKSVSAVVCDGPGAAPVGEALKAAHDLKPGVQYGHGPRPEVTIQAMALGHRTDEEAAEHLRRLNGTAPHLVLVERTRQDALSPRAQEEQLLQFALTGAPARSTARLAELAGQAGWRLDASHELGWGVEALVFASSGTAER